MHLVMRSGAGADTPVLVRDALRRAVEDAGAIAPTIEVDSVPAIEREPGDGAKLRLVKSLRSGPSA